MNRLSFLNESPKKLGYRQPAEWAPHRAVWTAYPYRREEWHEPLAAAQIEFRNFCQALVQHGGEDVHVVFPTNEIAEQAAGDFAAMGCHVEVMSYGDVWLRDTAPVFVTRTDGPLGATCFSFNGWGGKFVMAGDEDFASRLADHLGVTKFIVPIVLEGGSIDVDGAGTALTTRQCLLNENRNPGMSAEDLEDIVKEAYGLESLLWLDDGLLNDHTDGHIDNIARFVNVGKVVCMVGRPDDPNFAVLNNIKSSLNNFRDAGGKPLEVIEIPSVGKVLNASGDVMPASYMNFYIANRAVIVPIYGTPNDEPALAKLQECFVDKKVIGVHALNLLSGGGSFHCMTQQVPK